MQTVLIVDDVQTDRELAGKVVTSVGHKPLYAADGNEALEKAKAHKPALILLDVLMPKQDGFKTCRALKQDPTTASIPVVLVTTKRSDSDRFWGQRQGADEHVAKPFSPDTLAEIVRRFVR